MDRLDKILVSQGIGSRKDVRKLIGDGKVTVNGVVCKKPETKVNAEYTDICVSGQALSYSKFIYIMMNKPAGVICATEDKSEKTVMDILPPEYRRKGIFPAGRLDKDTEGLLIITNDGEFAHKMLSPKSHVDKRYYVELDSEVSAETVEKFKKGIVFADGTRCRPAKLELFRENPHFAQVVICEGKFHQIKKMFAVCGLKVKYLKRLAIGNLELDSKLPTGGSKLLSNLDKSLIFFGKMH